ncbi:MAG: HD domain-containing protein [Clostridiaceae bacterium]
MDIINIIKEALIKINIEGFIVGGYLRDSYLKEKSKDIDIAVSDKIEELIKMLEEKGIRFFLLSDSDKIYRANYNNSLIDITIIRGKSIYEDLMKRDFSINSIALSLQDDKIIDTEKGIADIENKILRTNDKDRIKEDPVRILRGIRFILKYGFTLDNNTKDSFKEFACKIKESKKERKFMEFMKIIEEDTDGVCFSVMDKLGVLEYIIPYSKENKTIGKCKYHVEDALTHMITTYKTFRCFMKGEIELNIDTEGLFRENISFFSLKYYQALAAFIHDIGKYTCYNKKGDKITFYDHQIKGEEIAVSFLQDYGFPKKAEKFISNLVLGHMEPLIIFKSRDTNKQYLKFFRKYQDFTPYIIILSFCDVYATGLYYDPEDEIVLYKSFIEYLYAEFLRYKDIIQNPVISAVDLIAAKGLEGRKIKEAVDLINEKTYLGEVKDKFQALNIIKGRSKI